ncbi:MAG: hypothetical protein WCV90_00440 [Candidatus Woesearchaeota archaeon]
MADSKQNQKQREEFVIFWADFVRTHPDEEWSAQQNVLINSQLKSAHQFTREEYLKFKGED